MEDFKVDQILDKDSQDEVIDLLNEKSAILEMVFQATNAFYKSENERESGDYVNLIERRNIFFEDLAVIDNELQLHGFEQMMAKGAADFKNEVEKVQFKITETVKQIIELDKSIADIVSNIMVDLKSNMKNISANKNISNVYGNSPYSGVSRFDKRK